MKISIAMATYNGADYLPAQLESLAAQTRRPDELVVTDDCSTDETLRILDAFSRTAPFEVFYERNERTLGYGANFNKALLKTTGDLVFICDQDDVWFPQKIERIARVAEADPRKHVIMNDAALTDAKLNDCGLTKLGQIYSAGFDESYFVMGCCAAVKRDLLNLCLPIPEGYPSHDAWVVSIAEGMGRKHIIREVLQYYRRHSKNQSQIVVNRISRVRRSHVLLSQLRKGAGRLFGLSDTSRGSVAIDGSHQSILLKWARGAAEGTTEPFCSELRQYVARLEVYVGALEKRSVIRQRGFLPRVAQAILFWRSGGYAAFSGAKTLLRDIFSL